MDGGVASNSLGCNGWGSNPQHIDREQRHIVSLRLLEPSSSFEIYTDISVAPRTSTGAIDCVQAIGLVSGW